MTLKSFNGVTELVSVQPMDNKPFAQMFPGVKGKRWDGISMKVGRPINSTPVFVQDYGWAEYLMPVDREVNYKDNGSKHVCDARCMNATGRTMNCECSCGGVNHGKGFSCD